MKYTFKQIKEYLQEQKPIKFSSKNSPNIPTKLNDFLVILLNLNRSHDTVYDNGKIQTVHGKRRSIGDLYRITYYYFPRVALITVYKAMLSQIASKTAVSAICAVTGMRVYRFASGEVTFFNSSPTDEFNVDISAIEGFDKVKANSGGWGYDYTTDNIKLIKI